MPRGFDSFVVDGFLWISFKPRLQLRYYASLISYVFTRSEASYCELKQLTVVAHYSGWGQRGFSSSDQFWNHKGKTKNCALNKPCGSAAAVRLGWVHHGVRWKSPIMFTRLIGEVPTKVRHH